MKAAILSDFKVFQFCYQRKLFKTYSNPDIKVINYSDVLAHVYLTENNFCSRHTLTLNLLQSELLLPIPRNAEESDHGCTSMTYFENADDNVMLTSQKPC